MECTRAPLIAIMLSIWALPSFAELPPVPVPAENPHSEPKRILGKILFWDEQLSSNNTVACGTCHRPAAGGGDPRAGRHPGVDAGTIDDVLGSPGIVSLDRNGQPVAHPVFGRFEQVTARNSPSNFGALWAAAVFWDGRAGGELRDPLTGEIVIATGGALENQALAALSNDAEMTRQGREWADLTSKLARIAPLAVATSWPDDVAAILSETKRYPTLFAAAFGDPAITPVRIAFAIGSYQRTLIADQTPWDRYEAGELDALNRDELYGLRAMQDFQCVNCHQPPLFTSNDFVNIGLRRAEYDLGRQQITDNPEHSGDMKVPSLRNVGLRKRFMHTGEFASLGAAITFYRTGPPLPNRDRLPNGGIYAFNMSSLNEIDLHAFLRTGLTDPRVRDELFPFDRPVLRTERHLSDTAPPQAPTQFAGRKNAYGIELTWQPAIDNTGVVDYVLQRDKRIIAYLTVTSFIDTDTANKNSVIYRLFARDAAGNMSASVVFQTKPQP